MHEVWNRMSLARGGPAASIPRGGPTWLSQTSISWNIFTDMTEQLRHAESDLREFLELSEAEGDVYDVRERLIGAVSDLRITHHSVDQVIGHLEQLKEKAIKRAMDKGVLLNSPESVPLAIKRLQRCLRILVTVHGSKEKLIIEHKLIRALSIGFSRRLRYEAVRENSEERFKHIDLHGKEAPLSMVAASELLDAFGGLGFQLPLLKPWSVGDIAAANAERVEQFSKDVGFETAEEILKRQGLSWSNVDAQIMDTKDARDFGRLFDVLQGRWVVRFANEEGDYPLDWVRYIVDRLGLGPKKMDAVVAFRKKEHGSYGLTLDGRDRETVHYIAKLYGRAREIEFVERRDPGYFNDFVVNPMRIDVEVIHTFKRRNARKEEDKGNAETDAESPAVPSSAHAEKSGDAVEAVVAPDPISLLINLLPENRRQQAGENLRQQHIHTITDLLRKTDGEIRAIAGYHLNEIMISHGLWPKPAGNVEEIPIDLFVRELSRVESWRRMAFRVLEELQVKRLPQLADITFWDLSHKLNEQNPSHWKNGIANRMGYYLTHHGLRLKPVPDAIEILLANVPRKTRGQIRKVLTKNGVTAIAQLFQRSRSELGALRYQEGKFSLRITKTEVDSLIATMAKHGLYLKEEGPPATPHQSGEPGPVDAANKAIKTGILGALILFLSPSQLFSDQAGQPMGRVSQQPFAQSNISEGWALVIGYLVMYGVILMAIIVLTWASKLKLHNRYIHWFAFRKENKRIDQLIEELKGPNWDLAVSHFVLRLERLKTKSRMYLLSGEKIVRALQTAYQKEEREAADDHNWWMATERETHRRWGHLLNLARAIGTEDVLRHLTTHQKFRLLETTISMRRRIVDLSKMSEATAVMGGPYATENAQLQGLVGIVSSSIDQRNLGLTSILLYSWQRLVETHVFYGEKDPQEMTDVKSQLGQSAIQYGYRTTFDDDLHLTFESVEDKSLEPQLLDPRHGLMFLTLAAAPTPIHASQSSLSGIIGTLIIGVIFVGILLYLHARHKKKRAEEAIQQLSSSDYKVRRFAAGTLYLKPHRRALPALEKALGDEDNYVRAHAVGALGKLRLKMALPLITDRLADDAPSVRVEAMNALSHFGKAAIPALMAAMASENPRLQSNAVRVAEAIDQRKKAPDWWMAVWKSGAVILLPVIALVGKASAGPSDLPTNPEGTRPAIADTIRTPLVPGFSFNTDRPDNFANVGPADNLDPVRKSVSEAVVNALNSTDIDLNLRDLDHRFIALNRIVASPARGRVRTSLTKSLAPLRQGHFPVKTLEEGIWEGIAQVTGAKPQPVDELLNGDIVDRTLSIFLVDPFEARGKGALLEELKKSGPRANEERIILAAPDGLSEEDKKILETRGYRIVPDQNIVYSASTLADQNKTSIVQVSLAGVKKLLLSDLKGSTRIEIYAHNRIRFADEAFAANDPLRQALFHLLDDHLQATTLGLGAVMLRVWAEKAAGISA